MHGPHEHKMQQNSTKLKYIIKKLIIYNSKIEISICM